MIDALSAGLSGFANIIGNVGNAIASQRSYKDAKRLQELAYQHNVKLSRYQYDLNSSFYREMWDKTNRYNSPESVMKRYIDAGLNPNLIYGNGTNASSSMGNIPQYKAPTMSYGNLRRQVIPNAFNASQERLNSLQAANIQAQNDNLRAQNSYLHAQAANEAAKLVGIAADSHSKGVTSNYAERMASYGFQMLQQQVSNEQERGESLKKDNIIKETLKTLNEFKIDKLNPLEEQLLRAAIRSANASADVDEFYSSLVKSGIDPKDPFWARWAQRIVGFLKKHSPFEFHSDGIYYNPKDW